MRKRPPAPTVRPLRAYRGCLVTQSRGIAPSPWAGRSGCQDWLQSREGHERCQGQRPYPWIHRWWAPELRVFLRCGLNFSFLLPGSGQRKLNHPPYSHTAKEGCRGPGGGSVFTPWPQLPVAFEGELRAA